MFALRGIIVSLAVFAIVYCALSLVVGFSWQRIFRWVQRQPSRRAADLLFALRMLPLAGAAMITAAFTVPSFLLLEPRSIDEPISSALAALAIAGVGLCVFGLVNAAVGMFRASRVISAWTFGAESCKTAFGLPVWRISQAWPAMTAVGIRHPKIFFSGAAEFVLNDSEMLAALRHEAAHVRHRDNAKKLLLRFVTFPGMRGLEAAWLESTETSADEAAVSTASEALDLASALVTLSRLLPAEPALDLTTAIVSGPIAIINARVERLIAWHERPAPRNSSHVWLWINAGLVAAAIALGYGPLLIRIHAATEWLVR
jgi:hypothetical protein